MARAFDELMYQSGLTAQGCWDELGPYEQEAIARFAHLIVQRCVAQINKVEVQGDAHLGGGYFYDGTRLCRDAILEHFEVEL